MSTSTIYLVILHERGCADAIAAFASREGADADVGDTKAQFGNRYSWKRAGDRWDTTDDGPWIEVRECAVKP